MDAFVGQLLLVGFNFAPKSWALCAGQLLPLAQNTTLFSLIGVNYGGDGKSNFALPDMRGRVAMSYGQGSGLSPYVIGEDGGTESVTLLLNNLPSHTHSLMAVSGRADQAAPGNNVLADPIDSNTNPVNIYAATGGATMNQAALSVTGSSLPHNNMMPYQALNWVIALQGIFPSRS